VNLRFITGCIVQQRSKLLDKKYPTNEDF